MKYSTLLFDVDDTLLNFQAAEHDALKKLFKTIGQPLTSEVYADYHTDAKLVILSNLAFYDHLNQISLDMYLPLVQASKK